MRPSLLAPLFAPARSLKGVGPRIEGLLNKLVAPRHQSAHARVIDLLWHLPQGVIDRALTPRIADARIGELATLEVTVTEHRPGGPRRGARAPYRVLVEDASGALELVYFNADPAYLKRLLPEGSRRLISGKLESYDGWLQMPHPDHVVAVDAATTVWRSCPCSSRSIRSPPASPTRPCAKSSPRRSRACPPCRNGSSKAWHERNAWPSFADALKPHAFAGNRRGSRALVAGADAACL